MGALDNTQVAVIGLGASGRSAARLCLQKGAAVLGFDPREVTVDEVAAGYDIAPASLRFSRIEPTVQALRGHDLVVVSPGVPPKEALTLVAQEGVAVVGEMELASRFIDAPIALVGGTNGKSTVTAWLGDALEAAGRHPYLGGNYGPPACDAPAQDDCDVVVFEVSSFQAERMPTLRARVAALLNITEDHLDRYETFQQYADAKGNPFASMTPEDTAVIPVLDEVCLAQVRRGGASVLTFGSQETAADVNVAGDTIEHRGHGEFYSLKGWKLSGDHNRLNAAAVVAMGRALGVPQPALQESLLRFSGLAHRNRLVAEIAGVRYYNDSKATNVGASVAALSGMRERRVVLIAGGRDKNGSYEALVAALSARNGAVVLLGEATERLRAAIGDAAEVAVVDSLSVAVLRAAQLARRGDAVLLSPACSSYDMFKSYMHRGAEFERCVQLLAAAASRDAVEEASEDALRGTQ